MKIAERGEKSAEQIIEIIKTMSKSVDYDQEKLEKELEKIYLIIRKYQNITAR